MDIFTPGTLIDRRYEILSHPLVGGMGTVYFGMDREQNIPIALKTIRPEFLASRSAHERFLKEGTTWVELGYHPHIVQCYKVGYSDPLGYLVLELVANRTDKPDASLRSWLVGGRSLTLEQSLLFTLQIVRGMQYATKKIPGFVHRDLKPENILVGIDNLPGTEINRIRVTDFGLVKTLSSNEQETTNIELHEKEPNIIQFTRGVGTPLYMAPELWRGEKVGDYTDIYALGCILYEMVSGRYFVNGQTLHEIEVAHCNRSDWNLPAELPKDVGDIIKKCLSLNPKERYFDWDEAANAIQQSCKIHNIQSELTVFPTDNIEKNNSTTSFLEIGLAYYQLGDLENSKNNVDKALQMAKRESNSSLAASALSSLMLINMSRGDIQETYTNGNELLNYAKEKGNLEAEAIALVNLGKLNNLYIDDQMKAISCYEQAVKLSQSIGNYYSEGQALSGLGECYRLLGNFEKGIEYGEQALSLFRKFKKGREVGNLLGNLGINYAQLGDFQTAIKYQLERLEIAQSIADLHGQGQAFGNLGEALAYCGELDEAEKYQDRCLAIMKEVGDIRGILIACLDLAQLYEKRDKYEKAIDSYNMGLSYTALKDNSIYAIILEKKASLLLKHGQVDDARNCHRQFTQLQSQSPSILIKQASYALILDDITTAINRATKAREIDPNSIEVKKVFSICNDVVLVRKLVEQGRQGNVMIDNDLLRQIDEYFFTAMELEARTLRAKGENQAADWLEKQIGPQIMMVIEMLMKNNKD